MPYPILTAVEWKLGLIEVGSIAARAIRNVVPFDLPLPVAGSSWLTPPSQEKLVYMSDVPTFVKNVLAEASPGGVRRLNIIGHGDQTGLHIGSDWISERSLDQHEGLLASLRPIFHSGSFVHLQHCYAGQLGDLLKRLARIFGVPVIGAYELYAAPFGTQVHAPEWSWGGFFPWIIGAYIEVNPHGTMKSHSYFPYW